MTDTVQNNLLASVEPTESQSTSSVRVAKWTRLFLLSAAVLLFITGGAKLVSVFGRTAILTKPDPILGMPFQYLFVSAGSIELFVSAICLLFRNGKLPLFSVFVLSLNFLAYRMALRFAHWDGYCPCLGTLTAAIHISPQRADFWLTVVLGYLLIGSLLLLISSYRLFGFKLLNNSKTS